MTHEEWALLNVILDGQPRLAGALCASGGLWPAFEPYQHGESHQDVEHRHQVALRLCFTCPCLSECRSWVQGLSPEDRPGGIVAGQINRKATP